MMKELSNFLKKLFGDKLKPVERENSHKCEPEIPAEHIRVVEETPAKEDVSKADYLVEVPVNNSEIAECKTSEEKPAPKKKRTYRKKKSETTKK